MIRKYQSSDVEPLISLFTQTVHKVSCSYYSPEEVEAWAPSTPADTVFWDDYFSTRFTLLDEREGLIVGFGCLSASGNVVDMLFTHHAHQNEGVGSAIIDALEAEALRYGQQEIFLTTSATAWHFYLKRGYRYFKSEKKPYRNIEFDCQILRKALPVFPPMRRHDRELDADKAKELLHNGNYGFLAMSAVNGYGYGIPVNYVPAGDSIYFHCAQDGFKLKNLRHNNRVSFCVVSSEQVCPERFTTAYESVMVFGRVVTEISDKEKTEAMELLVRKYCPQQAPVWQEHIQKSFHITGVLRLDIERLTGKKRKF
ncbi:MAG: GNAT family N-acetyltransferase [Bacteroidales bacterium]|jgi:nitroimidazol reductase NimA-like FMN-containing flavoprotein (pyridoxamine 5'-phosphate oxidase superfamily)/GNAT superfamily N-acetyltransferase|nr:GNAT family N-acetyltransferase [Bacteroidales bacterium]